ncbi:hypothetical protein DL764_000719 [Monosporascus ibericus]|uniref:Aflatoxin regulatory protein domain-containing protein n=1 Tax=Monosporascus ibericus TaxID=155417 RepID=A0A4Q4TSG8_9PEZI|nr:hypothetical protein DL764_000719 [Monosporascus ibericus]
MLSTGLPFSDLHVTLTPVSNWRFRKGKIPTIQNLEGNDSAARIPPTPSRPAYSSEATTTTETTTKNTEQGSDEFHHDPSSTFDDQLADVDGEFFVPDLLDNAAATTATWSPTAGTNNADGETRWTRQDTTAALYHSSAAADADAMSPLLIAGNALDTSSRVSNSCVWDYVFSSGDSFSSTSSSDPRSLSTPTHTAGCSSSSTQPIDTASQTAPPSPPPLTRLAATSSSNHHRHDECACFSRVMRTFEVVEVNLVWDLGQLSDIRSNVLQLQTRALVECEDLITGCVSCTRQSAYVLLVVSLCGKILSSLETVCSRMMLPGPSSDDDGGGRSFGQVASPAHSRRPGACQGGGGHLGLGACYENSNTRSRLNIRRWHIDDDDELQILQTLLTKRLKHLDNLLERLEELISSHNWPAHADMCHALKRRLATQFLAVRG